MSRKARRRRAELAAGSFAKPVRYVSNEIYTVAVTAEIAKANAGRTDDPIDTGPAESYYRPGSRIWRFPAYSTGITQGKK